jgi:hypothetical protein
MVIQDILYSFPIVQASLQCKSAFFIPTQNGPAFGQSQFSPAVAYRRVRAWVRFKLSKTHCHLSLTSELHSIVRRRATQGGLGTGYAHVLTITGLLISHSHPPLSLLPLNVTPLLGRDSYLASRMRALACFNATCHRAQRLK